MLYNCPKKLNSMHFCEVIIAHRDIVKKICEFSQSKYALYIKNISIFESCRHVSFWRAESWPYKLLLGATVIVVVDALICSSRRCLLLFWLNVDGKHVVCLCMHVLGIFSTLEYGYTHIWWYLLWHSSPPQCSHKLLWCWISCMNS